jgi:hypothetical protein
MSYYANQLYPVAPGSQPEGGDPVPEILIEIDPPAFGIVTTQSCDLDKSSDAWVQVALVRQVKVSNEQFASRLRAGLVRNNVLLDGPGLPEPKVKREWVADLTLEVPIEKGWFVGRPVGAGFSTEGKFIEFAERLAERRSRVALPTNVVEAIVSPLKSWIEEDPPTRLKGIVEVRMHGSPSLTDPSDAVGLLLLCDADPCFPPTQELWEQQWDECRSASSTRGLTLVAPRFASQVSLTAGEYIRSARIDLEYLSSG